MGDEASLLISESKAYYTKRAWLLRDIRLTAYRENSAQWNRVREANHVGKRHIFDPDALDKCVFRVTQSEGLDFEFYPIRQELENIRSEPHLMNFFDCIRDGKGKLNCPAEEAYKTAVAVLKANEAMKGDGKITFKKDDFEV